MENDCGIIKQIYLKDFVTYDEIIITPGRSLNMIIGPNGTGKSTIVSAIALCFGAPPKILGKDLTIGKFVKEGCETAVIEIEIAKNANRNTKFKRIFTNKNRTTWMFDGQKVTEAKIHEEVEKFNIQVENLCQFLPQERVGNFSEMNPRELLINTEKSVGDPKLYEYHMKLINDRKTQGEINDDITQKKTVLESQSQRYKELEENVSHIKEKKAMKNKIKSLEQKKAWVTYDVARKSVTDLKEQSKQAETRMKQFKTQIQPILNQINKKEEEINTLQESVKVFSQKVKVNETKFVKKMDEIETLHGEIKNIKNICKNEMQTVKNRDKEIKKVEIQKNKLENDMELMLKDVGTEESISSQIQSFDINIQNERDKIDDLRSKITFYREKFDRAIHKINESERRIRELSDVDSKRLDILRSCNKNTDAYKGVLWLRSNMDKFRGAVYEPMFMSIDITDNTYARYFERIINQKDLFAFVCEDKQDMNLLLEYLRDQQGLRISVVHSDPRQRINTEPRVPLQNIKRFGFFSYAISFIQAPDTIMKYLVSMYNLNNIPFGTSAVEEQIENIPEQINCYFSPQYVYSSRKSRYTGDMSIKTSRLSATASMFTVTTDSASINLQKRILEEATAERTQYDVKLKAAETQQQELKTKLEYYRNGRSKLAPVLTQMQTLKRELNKISDEYDQLQGTRKSIDEIKNTEKTNIQKVVKKQMNCYEQCLQFQSKAVEILTNSKSNTLQLRLAERELDIILCDSSNVKASLKEAEQAYNDIERRLGPMKAEAEKLYNIAFKKTDGVSPSDKTAFAKYSRVFAKLPLQISEIEEKLRVYNAKLYCMSDNENGEEILQEYERTKESVNTLEEELKQLNKELAESQANIEELREKWLPLITNLAEAINSKFTTYFMRLGCVGEMVLHHADDPMDFEKYEFKISVKFRDADNLQEFTKQRQSGGERAVTTAIYMLSLQELCRVPFRCVDELNQGMDAVYERCIFDLLVELTSKIGSQYFLITPKLLPNLVYSESTKVHVINSGCYVVPQTQFNIGDYAQRLISMRRL